MEFNKKSRINHEIHIKEFAATIDVVANKLYESAVEAKKEFNESASIFIKVFMKDSNNSEVSKGNKIDSKDFHVVYKYFYEENLYLDNIIRQYENNNKLVELIKKYSENPDERDAIFEKLIPLAENVIGRPVKSHSFYEEYSNVSEDTKFKVINNIPQVELDESFIYEVATTLASMKEVRQREVDLKDVNGYVNRYMLKGVPDYISKLKDSENIISQLEEDLKLYHKKVKEGGTSDDMREIYNLYIGENTRLLNEHKKKISICNQAIKEDAIRYSDKAIHLTGKSGIPKLDILGEWTISFIDNNHFSIGSSNDMNIIRLNTPTIPTIFKEN